SSTQIFRHMFHGSNPNDLSLHLERTTKLWRKLCWGLHETAEDLPSTVERERSRRRRHIVHVSK
ncbi:hypothetical protein AVEN_207941-1, partial [Araneus ventricosus]